MPQGVGIWITGLPASGKSTITAALKPKLEALGHSVEVLESDEVRRALTPNPTSSHEERGLFYRALAFFGCRLTEHGVTVIFDATANKRAFRDYARELTQISSKWPSSARWRSADNATGKEPIGGGKPVGLRPCRDFRIRMSRR